jgi:hypothetical protein
MRGRYDILQEYTVLLRHAYAEGSRALGEAPTREFTTILNAIDEIGAQAAADALVLALRNHVTIVSITRI